MEIRYILLSCSFWIFFFFCFLGVLDNSYANILGLLFCELKISYSVSSYNTFLIKYRRCFLLFYFLPLLFKYQ